jgi:hypothetical protein
MTRTRRARPLGDGEVADGERGTAAAMREGLRAGCEGSRQKRRTAQAVVESGLRGGDDVD